MPIDNSRSQIDFFLPPAVDAFLISFVINKSSIQEEISLQLISVSKLQVIDKFSPDENAHHETALTKATQTM